MNIPESFAMSVNGLMSMLDEGDFASAARFAREIGDLCQAEIRARARPLVAAVQCLHCGRFMDDDGEILSPQPKTFKIADWKECNECAARRAGRNVLPPGDQ